MVNNTANIDLNNIKADTLKEVAEFFRESDRLVCGIIEEMSEKALKGEPVWSD